MASAQTPMSAHSWTVFENTPPIGDCDWIWVWFDHALSSLTSADVEQDLREARFSPCAQSVISTLPALLGGLILLRYSLRIFDSFRPRWTRPFIEETKASPDELDTPSPHVPAYALWGLIGVSSIGLTLQIIAAYPVFPSIAWVCFVHQLPTMPDNTGNCYRNPQH
jgi:hypothetical protein